MFRPNIVLSIMRLCSFLFRFSIISIFSMYSASVVATPVIAPSPTPTALNALGHTMVFRYAGYDNAFIVPSAIVALRVYMWGAGTII
jgi:hypothetical protein